MDERAKCTDREQLLDPGAWDPPLDEQGLATLRHTLEHGTRIPFVVEQDEEVEEVE